MIRGTGDKGRERFEPLPGAAPLSGTAPLHSKEARRRTKERLSYFQTLTSSSQAGAQEVSHQPIDFLLDPSVDSVKVVTPKRGGKILQCK